MLAMTSLEVAASPQPSSFEILKTQVEALLRNGDARAALTQLVLAQPEQENNSDFDYLLGTTALIAESPEIAINALERVVMMQPNFAGAWLDLAIAYYRAGDERTAAQLITHLEENFDPPAPLRAQLLSTKRKINQAYLKTGWHANGGLMVAHVKNANYGLSQSSFQITPTGSSPIDVVIGPDSKARSDDAIEFRGEAYRQFIHGSQGRSELQLAMRARDYMSVNSQNFMDVSAYWVLSQPLSTNQKLETQSGLSARYMMVDGSSVGTFVSAFTGIKSKIHNCDLTSRFELEHRAFNQANQANSNIPWVGFGISCPVARWAFEGSYRYGWDKPEGARAGGQTERQEASLQTRWRPSDTLQMRVLGYYADYKDAEGYSSLLNNGARRVVHRTGKRLELAWQLPLKNNDRWTMQIEFDDIKNHSNIATSSFDDTQIFAGLRYQLF
jgi:tetratricopeptide (TPR) repeat protein